MITCHHVYKVVVWIPVVREELLMQKYGCIPICCIPIQNHGCIPICSSIRTVYHTPLVFIWHLAFIALIVHPNPCQLNEIRYLYETGDTSRQYGTHNNNCYEMYVCVHVKEREGTSCRIELYVLKFLGHHFSHFITSATYVLLILSKMCGLLLFGFLLWDDYSYGSVPILFPGGVNNILPNLDLVYVAVRLCEQERLNTAFHIPVCANVL